MRQYLSSKRGLKEIEGELGRKNKTFRMGEIGKTINLRKGSGRNDNQGESFYCLSHIFLIGKKELTWRESN